MSGISPGELIETVRPIFAAGKLSGRIEGITQDSRKVRPGFIFAARSGRKASAVEYLQHAVKNGAVCILSEDDPVAEFSIPWLKVSSFRVALMHASNLIYRDPSKNLRLFGITGTNGKTSTVHLLRSIFETCGTKCAMLSTVGYWTGAEMLDAPLTTPDIDTINRVLARGVEAGSAYATMEVSSHALDQGRTSGLSFAGAGFTNLTVDHLDYHGSLIEYSIAKERLFRALPLNATAAININSGWGARMVRACWSPLITIGDARSGADLRVNVKDHTVTGATYTLEWHDRTTTVKTPLVGVYQGENLALAAALALAEGVGMPEVLSGIEKLKAVPGRMEAVQSGQPFALFIDYAHTPDALGRAIRSLRPLTSGRIIVVFGCGGDRDRTKRPQMGRIAAEEADRIIITSDNPRTEDPSAITTEIYAGIHEELKSKVTLIVDRREATLKAAREARAGDILLLAGKGSENFQEINNIRHDYDDRIVSKEVLREIGYKSAGGL